MAGTLLEQRITEAYLQVDLSLVESILRDRLQEFESFADHVERYLDRRA